MGAMSNREDIIKAIVIINNAILELNHGKTDAEDFYWWRAVLSIFGLDVEDGEIQTESGEAVKLE